MAQFGHTVLFGNVLNINASKSGKVKFITLAEADFRKDRKDDDKSVIYDVAVFERSFEELAEIEAALAEVRAQKGNDKAALTGVKLDVFVNPQTGEDGRDIQLQFSKVVKPAEAAKAEAAKAEAVAEA